MAAIANRGDLDYETVHAHAEETANGFRLPIPVDWPAPVRSLIEDCWAQKSSKRPSFATIERRLEEIKVASAMYQHQGYEGSSGVGFGKFEWHLEEVRLSNIPR